MSPESRRLAAAAWITLVVHAAAGAAMLLFLKRGLGTNPELADRMLYVTRSTRAWQAAWFSWNLAAASILYFFLRMSQAHASRWSRAALAIGALAVVFDLSAEWIMMFRLPALARAGDLAGFVEADRLAVLLTGGAANALYTSAAVILTLATRSAYPAWTTAAGLGVGVAGALLTASAAAGSITGLFWTNAALVPLINAWLLGVALAQYRRR